MAARQIVNLFRGSVRLKAEGDFPERFLNLCAQRGVKFWAVDRPGESVLLLTVAWSDRKRLEELAARTGCILTVERKRGVPSFLLRFRKRYAFLLGLGLALLAASLLSHFVLVVEVEGNQTVPGQVILAELWRQGVRPGVYGPSLPVREIANRALLQLEDLSWMAINLHGIRAQVVVREKISTPEVIDRSEQGDIVAEAPGLITEMIVWSGDAAVREGDTVLPGDVLIRGSVRMDPPEYSEQPVRWMPVRAMGKVGARTWRTLTAVIPLEAAVKLPTGRECVQWSVTFLGRRTNFFEKSRISYAMYDKISNVWEPVLPGGSRFPLSLRRETVREYQTERYSIQPQSAQAMLEEQLTRCLNDLLGGTGREISHAFSAEKRDGQLFVTLVAECEEEVGRFVPAG